MTEEPSTSMREVVAEAAARQFRAALEDPSQEDRRRTLIIAAELAKAMIPGVAIMEQAAEHARNLQGPMPPAGSTEGWRTGKLEELREMLAAGEEPLLIGVTAARLARLTLNDTVMQKADFHAGYVDTYAQELLRADPATIKGVHAHARSLAHLNPRSGSQLSYANDVLRKVHEAVAFAHSVRRPDATEFVQQNLADALATPEGATPEQQHVHSLVRELHAAEADGRTADAVKAASGLTTLLQQAAATVQHYPTVGDALKSIGRRGGRADREADAPRAGDRQLRRGPRPRGK